jgi:hypothetical protein
VNAVAILGVCVSAVGVRFWFYKRLPRPTAWLLAIGFILLGIGIPVWTDTLASLTASQTGEYTLLGVLILTMACFYVEAIHKPKKPKTDDNGVLRDPKPDHYHRIGTMATAPVFGTAVVVTWIRWTTVSVIAKNSPATVSQTAQRTRAWVNSGQAAASITVGTQHVVLLAAFLIFAALVAMFVIYERHQPEKVAAREAKERARDRKKDKKAVSGSGRGALTGSGR